ncbi:MAG: LysR family transcriptional regulator [Clostridia bacterium]|nr:LysR family transcriptional regulator [Clostridia bacterium]
MNVLHMRYAVEVAKAGSISKAAEKLLIAQPNLSRAIKELEEELGIAIFERSSTGMTLTPEGEEFLGYARKILSQIDEVDRRYKEGAAFKQRFSICVPRACYISEAFTRFSLGLSDDPAEIFYKETNSQRTLNNLLYADYKLGIVRYARDYDTYYQALLEEKGLVGEQITEFHYVLLLGRENPLAQKKEIHFSDLRPYIEIAHADPFVPSLSMAEVKKAELPDDIERRIFVFERASQLELLAENNKTFMWVSPVPQTLLDRYGLVQRVCVDNRRVYRDVLIRKQNYRLSALDRQFIAELEAAKNTCHITSV